MKKDEFWIKKLGKTLIPINDKISFFIRKEKMIIVNDSLADIISEYNLEIVELDYYTQKKFTVKVISELENDQNKELIESIKKLIDIFSSYNFSYRDSTIRKVPSMNKLPDGNFLSLYLDITKKRQFYLKVPEEVLSIVKLSL